MSLLHYTNTFYSNENVEWTIEIHAVNDNTGSGKSFDSSGDGFNVTWQKGKHLRLPTTMPSTCKVFFLVTSQSEKDDVFKYFGANEGEYYIVIKKYTAVWWNGFIKPSYDSYEDKSFPYIATIKATDSIGRLKNKYNNSITTSGALDFRKLSYPQQLFYDLFNLDDAFTASQFFRFSYVYNWWHENQTFTSGVDPIQNQYYNRNAFVEDPENYTLTIKNYLEELNGVLRAMSCRMLFCNGKYWIMQENSLDSDNINAHQYLTPDSSTTFYMQNLINFVKIDNTQPVGSTNANIKNGATFTYDPELNSVRAMYVHGLGGVVFDGDNDYSSLTTIGLIGQDSNNYIFHPNIIANQTWATSDVTPTTMLQSNRMSCRFTCTLKVGSYYWNGNDWVQSVATFNLDVGLGTNYPNVYQSTTYCHFITFQSPYEVYAKTTQSVFMPGLPVFGEAQFMFTTQFFYWNNDAPTNLSLNQLIAAGTQYQNTSFNGATPLTNTQSLQTAPFATTLNPTFDTAEGGQNIGASYIEAQSPAVNMPDLNLGKIYLGTPANDQLTLGDFKYYNSTSGFYEKAGNFRRGNSGSYINPTRLLVKEYLAGQDEPVTILQGSVITTAYTPNQVLKYKDKIGGSYERYAFMNGTFKAKSDTYNGSWYKLKINPSPSTVVIFNPIHNNTFLPDILTDIVKQPDNGTPTTPILINDLINVVGNLTTALTSSGTNKIFNTATTCDLYDGQKLLVARPDVNESIEVVVNGAKSAGSTDIDIIPTTTNVNIPVGSKVYLKTNDLTNNITSGGGGGTPGGSNTEVQYNSNGSFAGSSGLTFDDVNLILTVKNYYCGGNIGHRSLYNGTTQELKFHLHPQDFMLTDQTGKTMYTRTNGGSVQASGHRRGEEIFAHTYLPIGFEITKIDVYMSVARPFALERSNLTSSTVVNIDNGNSNSTVTLSTPETTDYRNYYIIRIQPSAASDEIYGAMYTLEKL